MYDINNVVLYRHFYTLEFYFVVKGTKVVFFSMNTVQELDVYWSGSI